jgi:hypothetical protein
LAKPVPYFDGQVKVTTDWSEGDPEVWTPNSLKRDEEGVPVREALFSNHNAAMLLECEGESLIGRSELERGVAHKITPDDPLALQARRLQLKYIAPLQLDENGALTLDPAFQPGGGDIDLDNLHLTGTPTAPTPVPPSNSTTQIATTEFVQAAVSAGGTFIDAPSNDVAHGRRNAGWIPVLMVTGDVMDGGNF